MKQLTINIPDNKYSFIIELMRNFDFVKFDEEVYTEPSKEEIIQSIKQGLKEVKLIENGQMEATTLKDFLNEL
jgi:protein-arginine kinase